MSDNSNLNNLGNQFKGALNEALSTGDFKNLNNLVTDTVKTALSDAEMASNIWKEAQKEIQKATVGANKTYTEYRKEKMERERQAAAQTVQGSQTIQNAQSSRMTDAQRYYQRTGLLVKVENVGLVSGILFIVFGAIANIPLFILSLIGMANGWAATGFLLFFMAMTIVFICLGKNKLQLISRAKRYVKLCGSKLYGEVEALAAQMGCTPKQVAKELRTILRKGIIPSAHMDKKGTHLMLNDVVYKQYLEAEKTRVLQEKGTKADKAAEQATGDVEQTELEQMKTEGYEYIRKLRDMNDLIPGERISTKLYHLEELLKEIFEKVQDEPAQMNRMHKVMNYYLPTTLKLVDAYHEFDKVSDPGKDILSAKEEIESTIDAINNAFVELLNNLFQDKVFDVTTDAQVLQTMLASEGLTREMDLVTVNKE